MTARREASLCKQPVVTAALLTKVTKASVNLRRRWIFISGSRFEEMGLNLKVQTLV